MNSSSCNYSGCENYSGFESSLSIQVWVVSEGDTLVFCFRATMFLPFAVLSLKFVHLLSESDEQTDR